ncbi:DUF5691 domain-containing protein [Planctomicrobium sp. SH661]|uniref:DUF5691 domain-containing protein n=1 Tax=Planctomicrobium sp. SH661 TaxID=3448124 RepID=UPI003F5B6497
MNDLLKAALIGTGRQMPPPCASDDPTDRLLLQRGQDNPEQHLLLRAGAQAVYELAGTRTRQVPLLDQAPADDGQVPSPRVAQLLASVLTAQSIPLLPEFLEVLKSHGVSFPPRLLPIALNTQDPARRENLRTSLGNRARWLAQFNPEWRWIDEDGPRVSTAELRGAFETGSLNERAAAVRALRTFDPSAGRELLEENLSAEKGDSRRRLLEQMRFGLNADDEPFLESLMRDRSSKVREIVCELLNLIPTSQLTQRMSARAATLFHQVETSRGIQEMRCELPVELPEDWERDGIPSQPPPGWGQRSWWGRSLLERVPLSFWVDHFQSTPQELITQIQRDDSLEMLLSGWTAAAVRFQQVDSRGVAWHGPLWEANLKAALASNQVGSIGVESLTALAEVMSASDLDAGLISFLKRTSDVTPFPFDLWSGHLPAPWSNALSESYLKVTRRIFQTRSDAGAARWCQTLLRGAIGICPDLFQAALEPWSVSSDRSGVWRSAQLEPLLQRFGEVIRARHEFRQEVARCAEAAGTGH